MDFYTDQELASLEYSTNGDSQMPGYHTINHESLAFPDSRTEILLKESEASFRDIYPLLSRYKVVKNGKIYYSILSLRYKGKIVKWCEHKRIGNSFFPIYDAALYTKIYGLSKVCEFSKIYVPRTNVPGLYWIPRVLPRTIEPKVRTNPRFSALKNAMNIAKKEIEGVDQKAYYYAANHLRDHADLLGRDSLMKRFTSTKMTNAWLKFYECLTFLQESFSILPYGFLDSLHVAEAPGNFVSALHHYLSTNFSENYRWNWKANTFEEKVENMGYLNDDLGLIKKYRDRWLLGPSKNGDITLEENIKDFARRKYDLVTSDVKVVDTVNTNYDEEENMNAAVHLAHVLIAIESLVPGGTAVLKHFTLYESFSHDLVAIMTQCFERVFIYKPKTSKAVNSEIYLVGIRFQSKIPTERLYEILKEYRNSQNYSSKRSIYPKLPRYFEERLLEIETELADQQMASIRKTIQRAKGFISKGPRVMRELENDRIVSTTREWIETNNLVPIKKPL